MPLNEKLSPQLKQNAESTPDATDMEVVLELTEAAGTLPQNRTERIHSMQQSFAEQAKSDSFSVR